MSFLLSGSQQSAIPDSGVSRWEFEQDVTDSWGSNDGTIVGSPQFTTDSQVGTYALDFDGADDSVDFGNVPYSGGGFSFTAWVYPRSAGGVMGDVQNASTSGAGLSYDGSDIEWILNDGQSNILASIPQDAWSHAVGTANGTEKVLYVDGVEQVSNATSSLQGDGSLEVANGPDGFLDGIVDDPRVYDKELSSTEVSNLYNTGSISG